MSEELAYKDAAGSACASPENATELPPLNDFLKLIEEEQNEVAQDPAWYAVYHKYSKSC